MNNECREHHNDIHITYTKFTELQTIAKNHNRMFFMFFLHSLLLVFIIKVMSPIIGAY